jgi:hypothetical protein
MDNAPTIEYSQLVARNKSGLLVSMIKELAGNARISFEGDLSKCRLAQISGAASVETAVLKRNTASPVQDFIVVPLEPETVDAIIYGVLPEGGIVRNVVHVLIEKNGELAFASYDNFYPNSIICSPLVPKALLDRLIDSGVLKSYDPVPFPAQREGS